MRKCTLHEAIYNGVISRVRPVIMTALMAAIGLLPAAISHGIGSETQKPLAIVVIGGLDYFNHSYTFNTSGNFFTWFTS